LALLRNLHAEGITIILITHRMNEATLAERVVALADGRVAYDGPPRLLFAGPKRLASLGLEPPPLSALANELTRRCRHFPPGLLTLDELVDALVTRLPHPSTPGPPASIPSHPEDASAVSTHPVVAVRDLQHTYLAGTPFAARSLTEVSLKVCGGEAVAVLGPTGSGKSTLLQHIAGLLQPHMGEVLVDGPHGHQPFRKLVGMLFQRPEEQLFENYVGDDVAFGPRQLGLGREAVRRRVRWAMETAGLPFNAYKDRFTQGLSDGERRKAALAGVLALRPHLLALDEPTAGLDPHSRHSLLTTLRRLGRQVGMTLIIATHAVEDIATLCDRAFVLNGGRVAAEGTPRQLFSEPKLLADHGLEPPEVTTLMQRLRTAGAAVSTDVVTVEEAVMQLDNLSA
jgi:energy-coupling factor transport system ATP-binding protein